MLKKRRKDRKGILPAPPSRCSLQDRPSHRPDRQPPRPWLQREGWAGWSSAGGDSEGGRGGERERGWRDVFHAVLSLLNTDTQLENTGQEERVQECGVYSKRRVLMLHCKKYHFWHETGCVDLLFILSTEISCQVGSDAYNQVHLTDYFHLLLLYSSSLLYFGGDILLFTPLSLSDNCNKYKFSCITEILLKKFSNWY